LPPKQSFSKSFIFLDAEKNSYFILERNSKEYIQCGGSQKRCTIEIRTPTKNHTHARFTIGYRAEDISETHIPMSNGVVCVHANEVLTIEDAIILFSAFFQSLPIPSEYILREQEAWPNPNELYFDDIELGLSPATSHPKFIEIATEPCFYDGSNEFSPFGNDDGNDTLRALENWYRDEGSHNTLDFLEKLLADWDLGVPEDIFSRSHEEIEHWLSQKKIHERHLFAVCRAAIACAFGQLKIAGVIHEDTAKHCRSALKLLLWRNSRCHAEWAHVETEKSIILFLQKTIDLYIQTL